ncbi:uncharacterized protein RAG0_13199 [Rhynchosporium agropyri]|uniref:Uncharacterized protein n=1 Tax=Rhynchosporium agropyri TaxID=914238 RepID=A0A1E1LBN5_9HELO|nr:uncharacterized protein RAG0_13199 [Rhynchosporium agropyri]
MASTDHPLPDSKRVRPSTPIPFLAIKEGNETMAPITPHQPASDAPANPFVDSPDEASLYSITSALAATANLHSLQARSTATGDALQSNSPENGTAPQDFVPTMTSDFLTTGLKSSSSKSTRSTVPPSYRTSTSLVSSADGHAMKMPNAIANINANPFADPVPRVQIQDEHGPSTPLPHSTPSYNQNHTAGVGIQPISSPYRSFAPTPPPKSPSHAPGSNRWTSISSVTNRIHLGVNSSANRSNNSLAREALARDSAIRQDMLLANERAKSLQPSLQDPHLRPSPSAIRVAAELIRAREANVAFGAHDVVKSPLFWIAVLGVQVGLVSTSAAIAVIIETDRRGERAYVGTGRAFWLVISLLVFSVSVVAVWTIWLRRSGAEEEGMLRRLGCDEVGLLDRAVARDMEMGRMDVAAGEGGSISSLRESLRSRPRAGMPSAESLATVRTRDPEWQAMYATPQEIWQEESRKNLGDTPVRRGAFGMHKGGDQPCGLEEQQVLHLGQPVTTPTSAPLSRSDKTWEQRSNPSQKRASSAHPTGLTRSDKSWPLRSSPNAGPFADVPLEHLSPCQSPSPASDYEVPQHQTPPRNQLTLDTTDHSTTAPITIPTPTNTDTNTHARSHADTLVEILSPLSSLSKSVHDASESSIPPHHRPQFIQAHCVASEERVRSVRERIDSSSRCTSFTSTSTSTQNRDVSLIRTNTPSFAHSDMMHEYVIELEDRGEVGVGFGALGETEKEPDKRIGRRRSRSVGLDGLLADVTPFPEMGLADGIGGKTHQQRARDVLAGVKGHFATREQRGPRGRSLGSVVREKMAKLKEAGVEPDPEPTAPIPQTYQQAYSPLRTNPERERYPETFIICDDSPTTSPSRIPRKVTPHPKLSAHEIAYQDGKPGEC